MLTKIEKENRFVNKKDLQEQLSTNIFDFRLRDCTF